MTHNWKIIDYESYGFPIIKYRIAKLFCCHCGKFKEEKIDKVKKE